MKITLTALTLAVLLAPLSANALEMTFEQSEEIMVYGEIISVNEDGSNFMIRYQKSIFGCQTSVDTISKKVWLWCWDTEL